MVINYLGGGSFKLQSGQVSLLVDPDNNRFKADATLRTLSPANSGLLDEEEPQTDISFSGEYETKGIEILGLPVKEESGEKFLKTIYLVKWEDINFAFLGHLSKSLPAEIIDKIDGVDVLFIPVGGGHFIEPEAAAKIAKHIEPSFIIPSFYKSPADFLRAMGQKVEPEEKLVFKQKDLDGVKNRVVPLKS